MRVVVFLMLLAIACSPAKRLERLVTKHPYLFNQRTDTVVDTFTVVIPTVKLDTVVETKEGDTVVITKDNLKVKYVKLPGDSVYIEGECEGKTIVKEVKIPVAVMQANTSPWSTKLGKWITAGSILLSLVIGIAILFRLTFGLK